MIETTTAQRTSAMAGMDPNYPVTISLYEKDEHDDGWIPEKLTEAIVWLQGFLDQVPMEHQDEAIIEIRSDISYDCSHTTIEISYRRPPTDTDKQERLDQELQRRDERETRERQELYRLRLKYHV